MTTPDTKSATALKFDLAGILSEMKTLGKDLGDLGEMKTELTTVRAQLEVAKRNLTAVRQEFSEKEAGYKKYAGMASEEAKRHERLTAENKRLTDDNNELNAERQRILQQFQR